MSEDAVRQTGDAKPQNGDDSKKDLKAERDKRAQQATTADRRTFGAPGVEKRG